MWEVIGGVRHVFLVISDAVTKLTEFFNNKKIVTFNINN